MVAVYVEKSVKSVLCLSGRTAPWLRCNVITFHLITRVREAVSHATRPRRRAANPVEKPATPSRRFVNATRGRLCRKRQPLAALGVRQGIGALQEHRCCRRWSTCRLFDTVAQHRAHTWLKEKPCSTESAAGLFLCRARLVRGALSVVAIACYQRQIVRPQRSHRGSPCRVRVAVVIGQSPENLSPQQRP